MPNSRGDGIDLRLPLLMSFSPPMRTAIEKREVVRSPGHPPIGSVQEAALEKNPENQKSQGEEEEEQPTRGNNTIGKTRVLGCCAKISSSCTARASTRPFAWTRPRSSWAWSDAESTTSSTSWKRWTSCLARLQYRFIPPDNFLKSTVRNRLSSPPFKPPL